MQLELTGIPAAPPKPKKPRGNDRPIHTYTDAEREVAELTGVMADIPKISERPPLSYVGAKYMLYKKILDLLPPNTEELVSPFMGGASLELRLATHGLKVHAYDDFEPLSQ